MKRVIVLEEAAEDIETARDFYDEIEQGLEITFSNALSKTSNG